MLTGTTRIATEASRARVAIVSGSAGGGHDAMAFALRDEFGARHPGVTTEVIDGLALVSPDYPAKEAARVQRVITHAPVLWEAAVGVTRTRFGGAAARRVAEAQFTPGLRRHLEANQYDAVVSTYPGMTSALGKLRREGELEAPLSVVIIDSHPHPTWFARGATQHMAINPSDVARAEASNPLGDVAHLKMRAVRPAVDPRMTQPTDRVATRTAFGLPQDRPVFLLSGGSLGLLDDDAVRRLLTANRDAAYAVLTSRNAKLAEQVSAVDPERVHAIPFTREMPSLVQAVDGVLNNAAGMTTWESFAAGTPVVHYNVIRGHGEDGVRGLVADGLAAYARTDAELAAELAGIVANDGRAAAMAARARGLFTDEDVPRMSDAVLSTISMTA